ncbi:MAG: fibronectin type III domain-containing protein [Bythopirellula sp.]
MYQLQLKRLSSICLALLSACSFEIAETHADAALEGTNPAQWRLVWTTDPATTATLCWSTAAAGQQHRVHLRVDGSAAESVHASSRDGRYSARSPELYFHHVHLKDLQPATKYHVIIESDGQRSPAMYFVTAPVEDVPLSVIFGADSRSGHEARRQVNAMMAKMFTESQMAKRVPILALVHGGDFIVDGRNLAQWSRWMSDHELTVGSDGRLLPIIPARGNHDSGKVFNEVFAFPPQHKNYYALDMGPQLRLITLNTETSVTGDQLGWLKAELESSRPDKRWLVAQYHRPAFPAVKMPWMNLQHWVPLFEKFNVDLVCEGDGHNIKRTAPIRGFQIDSTGIVYIGEGGLGVGQRAPKAGRWYLNSPEAKVGSGHHVQLLTFDDQQLAYRVILLGGEVFDEYFRPVRVPVAVATQP